MTEIFDTVQSEKNLRIVAHRGTTVYAPENTLASFIFAGKQRAWAIETDLRATKDGRIVCIHNNDLAARYGADIKISEHNYSELTNYVSKHDGFEDIPNKLLKLPTLEEYLDICTEYDAIPFIEIKDEVVYETVCELRNRKILKRSVISSCNLAHLEETRKYSDDIFIHHIFSDEVSAEKMAYLKNSGVAFDYPDLDKVPNGFVEMIHKMGLKLCFRAGDTVENVRRMLYMGLDYIPSNRIYSI